MQGAPAPVGLFDPSRHEPLTTTPWNEAAARAAIVRIAEAAFVEFDTARGSWRTHPQDDPSTPDQRWADLYVGAGGAIWALRDLAGQGAIDGARFGIFQRVVGKLLTELPARAEAELVSANQTQHGSASYLCGTSGLLLLQWSIGREKAVADRLFEVVHGNLHNPVREALWGNAGTVLAAIHMAEATGEVRWMRLVQQAVAALLEELEPDDATGAWIWQQDLYGRPVRYLGAGHGFVGNVYPALRGAALLDELTVATFADRAWQTLDRTALRAGVGDAACVNWHPYTDAEALARALAAGRLPLVQDCHGAPGVVCRLADMPRTPGWDALLRGAAELTWRAGPLTKGASLCHGTGGSAMAMLKLWRRSREAQWLDRARALAMHMIEQIERARATHRQGRHTLWTGDLGAACVLWNCIVADDRFPTLDHF